MISQDVKRRKETKQDVDLCLQYNKPIVKIVVSHRKRECWIKKSLGQSNVAAAIYVNEQLVNVNENHTQAMADTLSSPLGISESDRESEDPTGWRAKGWTNHNAIAYSSNRDITQEKPDRATIRK
jgi:hypothetical protein